MAGEGTASVEITADVRNFARDAETSLDRALSRMRVPPVEVPISEDAQSARTAGERAGEEFGDGVRRGADGRLRDARGKFVSEGEKVGQAAGAAAGRSFGQGFGRDATTATARALSIAIPRLPSLIGPALITAGVGIASGIAVAAAAVLGSLLGAALLAGGGLGVIGLGAFLLREEPALKSAAKSLTDSVKQTFTEAAGPLLQPLTDALGVFEKMIVRIGPQVRDVFASIAPAIVPLAEGLAGLVENSLPGFNDLIDASVPLIKNLGSSLSDLGGDLSVMFSTIAEAGPELDIFFQDFMAGVGNAIRGLGEFIAWSARTYVALKDLAQNGFESETWQNITDAIRNVVINGLQYLIDNLPTLIDRFLEMKAAVLDAAVELVLGIANALPTILPILATMIVRVVTSLVTGLVDAIPAVFKAATALVEGLVTGLLNALPILIPAAIQIVTSLIVGILELIPTLIDAGLRLIQGLVEGLLRALPTVATALITAIPKIISAFIAAVPALLLAGIQIITAIVQGIGNALPAVADALRNNVIPTLLNTLREQGPKLIEQGALALQQLMQGWIDNLSIITSVITETIIPAMTELFQDAPQFIEAGIAILNTLLAALADNIGIITTFITDVFVPQVVQFLHDNPQVIDAAVNMIVTMVEGFMSSIGLITEFVVGTLIPVFTQVLIDNAPALAAAGFKIMQAFVGSLIRAIPSVVAASSRIGNNLLTQIVAFGIRMAVAGLNLITRFASGIISGVGGQVGRAVAAVRSAVIGAFSSAGSWLVGAGRAIISGLVSGIQSGFDRVRGLLNTLTGMLPDWKGPADVDRRILRESGQLVMQGFTQGLLDEQRTVQRVLADLTGGLPDWTGGPPRGGDGASAGGTGMSVTIAPGAIVIQGATAEKGIEAAEALLERLGQAAIVR